MVTRMGRIKETADIATAAAWYAHQHHNLDHAFPSCARQSVPSRSIYTPTRVTAPGAVKRPRPSTEGESRLTRVSDTLPGTMGSESSRTKVQALPSLAERAKPYTAVRPEESAHGLHVFTLRHKLQFAANQGPDNPWLDLKAMVELAALSVPLDDLIHTLAIIYGQRPPGPVRRCVHSRR